MTIYVIIAILLVLSLFLWGGAKPRLQCGSSVAYWSLWLILTLVAGLRYRVGIDTLSYETLLSSVPPITDFSLSTLFSVRDSSPGMVFITGISRLFTPWIWPVQLICALWFNYACAIFGRRYVKNRFLFIALYFLCAWLNLNFEVMAEGVAIGFFLMSWPSFRRGEWIKYYLWLIPALCFHLSAIVVCLLPVMLLPGLRKLWADRKYVIVFLCSALIAGLFLPWKELGMSIIRSELLPTEIGKAFAIKFEAYSRDYLSGPGLNPKGIIGILIKSVVYPLTAMLLLRKNSLPVVMGLFFMLIGIEMEPLRRLSNYFIIFCLAEICLGMERYSSRLSLVYKILLFTPLLFFVLIGYRGKRNVADDRPVSVSCVYVPYYSWLSPDTDNDREELWKTHFLLIEPEEGVMPGVDFSRIHKYRK